MAGRVPFLMHMHHARARMIRIAPATMTLMIHMFWLNQLLLTEMQAKVGTPWMRATEMADMA